ncbi:MAG: hypothetical protein C0459_01195 [Chitinophaga sp.]|jgi:steroid delta-isomerase-like uncharacterized protein|nr:hypothetical protein [Chitinophaga sp.]
MKKLYPLIIICMVVFTACRDLKNEYEIEDTVNRYFKALNKHDTVKIAKFYVDTAAIESPNWEGIKRGPDSARSIYARYFASTPDLKFNLLHYSVFDSEACAEFTMEGTLANPEAGTPDYMRGKKYKLKCATHFYMRGGKIYGAATYFDQVSFLKQVGFFDQPK